jgi:hypothetical protein
MAEATWWTTLRGAAIACLPLAFAVALSAQQSPEFPDLPADLAAGEGVTQPCLGSMPGEVLCGRFRVWENREARSGRTIDLAFVVLRALNDRGHTDAYTQFNGGPGVAVTPSAARFGEAHDLIRADRDLLFIDHRGPGTREPSPATIRIPAVSRRASRPCSRSTTRRHAVTCFNGGPTSPDTRLPTRWMTSRRWPHGWAMRN